jgi:hypothetical protein
VAQKTCETCLANCLLFLLNEKPSLENELKVLNEALKLSKWNLLRNFTIGHLNFLSETKSVEFDFYLENKLEYNLLRRLKKWDGINLIYTKIDQKLIKKLLFNKPLIANLDSWCIWGRRHYPHYVTILRKKHKRFEIYDPWDGKIKFLQPENLSNGISSLRNLIKITPEIIQIIK